MNPRALSRIAEHNKSFCSGMPSESTTILTYLLNNTTPLEFHDAVRRAIHGPMVLPSDVENLLTSLQTIGLVTSVAALAAKDDTPRHCVRCHSKYLEKENGLRACVVHHDKPQRIRKTENGVPIMVHFFPCCDKQTPVDFVAQYPHYVGRHTTSADNVHYNTTNICRCDPGKCSAVGGTTSSS